MQQQLKLGFLFTGLLLFSITFLQAQKLNVEGDAKIIGKLGVDPTNNGFLVTEAIHLRDGNFRIDNGEIRSFAGLNFHPDIDNSGDGLIRFLNSAGGLNMIIDEIGNVGIGTMSPSPLFGNNKLLEIEGINPQILLDDTLGTQDDFRMVNGGLTTDFQNATTNTDIMSLELPTGNVGIGTTTPAAKLTVDGDIQMSNANIPTGLTTEIGGNSPLLNLDMNFRHSNVDTTFRGAAFRIDGRGDGVLFQWLKREIGDAFGGPLMTIGDNGDVGIGVTNIQSNLHIKQTSGGNPRRGIRLERSDNTNYWTIHTGSQDRLNFTYQNVFKAAVDAANGAYLQFSDEKMKKNITSMDEVLPGVLQLQPKWYNYIDNEVGTAKSLGFIAQEVEQIFPNFTFEKEGTKALAYDYFAVLSIKAIQELSAEVEEKDELIQIQNEKIEDLETRLAQIEAMLQGQSNQNNSNTVLTSARLEQNQPNPFNGSTLVRYFIPQEVKQAELRITDVTGRTIKNVVIQARGEGQTTFDAATLSNGSYQYSLFLDNQLIDTKQMVLTKN
jgi:hypothetical protein